MKALLIADTDISVRTLSQYIRPYGFDIIRYRSVLKALDNIEEIEPDAVFISTQDFPRHWKTIVQYIRSDTGKDKTIIILLINERFTSEDADKAVHLGVQAIVNETLSASKDERQIAEIFARYKPVSPESNCFAYEHVSERAVFLFTNPVTDTIITGKIESLGMQEIRFRPDAPSATADLAAGELLDQCSLKLDGKIISAKCRIRTNSNLMILEFVELNSRENDIIKDFIAEAV